MFLSVLPTTILLVWICREKGVKMMYNKLTDVERFRMNITRGKWRKALGDAPGRNTVPPGHTVTLALETELLQTKMLIKSPTYRRVTERMLIVYGWKLKSLCTYFVDLVKAENMKSAEFYKNQLFEGYCMLTDIANFVGLSLVEILEQEHGKDSEL